jgi:murein L,D-transpeptidase YafK
MALTMNYPNPWDKFKSHTGSGIWFHATDDPSRLVRNFDSLGCVVVKDQEITEIYPQLKPRVSPIVIFADYAKDKEQRSPQRIAELKHFVNTWANAWAGKDLDAYIGMYHSKFHNDGKSLSQYRAFKGQLNKQYAKITVTVDHINVFSHPKYDVAIFNQVYESFTSSGATAKRAAGVKILYISRENNEPKIISEQIRNTKI